MPRYGVSKLLPDNLRNKKSRLLQGGSAFWLGDGLVPNAVIEHANCFGFRRT